MFRCTTNRYDALYARWLENPGSLLDLAGYIPGEMLLDLCGGTGAVSREALRWGADPSTITLMDLNPRCPDPRVPTIRLDVQEYAALMGPAPVDPLFDLIVIRQSAAYLQYQDSLVRWLASVLKPGGRLVFNTFRKPKWSFRTYTYHGKRFFELSWYFGKTVWHLQASPTIGLDITKFHWHSESSLRKHLGSRFHLVVHNQGRSQRWFCRRLP